jgi:hypothetical protein
VTGFDLTFSAPKSVSVLWGLSDPDVSRAVHRAHDAAVADALGYLERHATTAGGERVASAGSAPEVWWRPASGIARHGSPPPAAHPRAGGRRRGGHRWPLVVSTTVQN